jgi:hypothetical protein
MLPGIDIWNPIDVVHQEVQTRWRDDSIEILKRSRQRGVGDRTAGAESPAHGGVEPRRLSVGQVVFETSLRRRRLGLD